MSHYLCDDRYFKSIFTVTMHSKFYLYRKENEIDNIFISSKQKGSYDHENSELSIKLRFDHKKTVENPISPV